MYTERVHGHSSLSQRTKIIHKHLASGCPGSNCEAIIHEVERMQRCLASHRLDQLVCLYVVEKKQLVKSCATEQELVDGRECQALDATFVLKRYV